MSVPLITISERYSLLKAVKTLASNTSDTSMYHVAGIDKVTLADFLEHKRENINTLQKLLRSKNGYHFSSLYPVRKQKSNGDFRVICIPTVRDRIVQRAILDEYLINTTYGKFNGINYGFVKGKGIAQAIKTAVEYRNQSKFVVKTDVCNFFDSIKREELFKEIIKKVKAKSLHKLIMRAVSCEIDQSIDERLNSDIKRKNKIIVGVGVRQGMPISPFIANLFLYDFDIKVLAKGYKCVRYADDLIFFADTYSKAEKILRFCKSEMKKIGLSIPDESPLSKTRIIKPHEPVEFLGLIIEQSIPQKRYISTIPKKIIEKKIYPKFKDLLELDKQISEGKTISQVLYTINQTVNAYTSIYKNTCEKEEITKFTNTLNSLAVNVKQHLYSKALGVQVSHLSRKQKKFLQINYTPKDRQTRTA